MSRAAFRLRALEHGWILPLLQELENEVDREELRAWSDRQGRRNSWIPPESAAVSTGALRLVLLTEASRWVRLGQRIGYFSRNPRPFPYALHGSPISNWTAGWSQHFFTGERMPNPTSDEYFMAITTATESGSADHFELLRLLAFAPNSEWEQRLNDAAAVVKMLSDDAAANALTRDIDAISWLLVDLDVEPPGDIRFPHQWRAAPPSELPEVDGRIAQFHSLRQNVEAAALNRFAILGREQGGSDSIGLLLSQSLHV